MGLADDLSRIAAAARAFAAPGEEVAAVIPAEPASGQRTYLCAYARGLEQRAWLALDDAGEPVVERLRLRDAVSIAAMCELAEETAGGGDLDELRSQLVAVRITENPPGLEAAEAAVGELERAIAPPPRIASPAYLDAIGLATRKLEQSLGEVGRSPFADAMRAAVEAVDGLLRDVEGSYKGELV